MSKYHISPHDQIARKCSAKVRECDYKISESNHLNADQAVKHNAKIAQGANPTVATLTKPKKTQGQIINEMFEPKQTKADQEANKAKKKGRNKANSTPEENEARKAYFNSEPGGFKRHHVVASKPIPIDVQDDILNNEDTELLKALAGNPHADPNVLYHIALNNAQTAENLSANPNTPYDKLKEVASNSRRFSSDDTIFNLTIHPNGNDHINDTILANTSKKGPRIIVAGSPRTTDETLEKLAKSKDHDIHKAILDNPKKSIGALTTLMANESVPFVISSKAHEKLYDL